MMRISNLSGLLAALVLAGVGSARADFIVSSTSVTTDRSGTANGYLGSSTYTSSVNGTSSLNEGSALASSTNSVTLTQTASTIGMVTQSSNVESTTTGGATTSANTDANARIYFQVGTSGNYDVAGSASINFFASPSPYSLGAPSYDVETVVDIYNIDADEDLYFTYGFRETTGGSGDPTGPPATVALTAGTNYEVIVSNYATTSIDGGAPAELSSTVESSIQLSQSPAAVPEPSTLILLGTGMAGVAGYSRRKRRTT